MARTEAEGSKFHVRYSDDQILEAIRAQAGAASTREVADHLGCHRTTAYNRLQELAESGVIATRKISANARIWTAT